MLANCSSAVVRRGPPWSAVLNGFRDLRRQPAVAGRRCVTGGGDRGSSIRL